MNKGHTAVILIFDELMASVLVDTMYPDGTIKPICDTWTKDNGAPYDFPFQIVERDLGYKLGRMNHLYTAYGEEGYVYPECLGVEGGLASSTSYYAVIVSDKTRDLISANAAARYSNRRFRWVSTIVGEAFDVRPGDGTDYAMMKLMVHKAIRDFAWMRTYKEGWTPDDVGGEWWFHRDESFAEAEKALVANPSETSEGGD